MMFNLFGIKSPQAPKAEDGLYTLAVQADGLLVTGPQEAPSFHAKPKKLEEALWQYRGQLTESGYATPQTNAETNAIDYPMESWTALHVSFDSLTGLKEGFATPQPNEPMPELFDPILSDLLPPLTDWTLKIEPETDLFASQDYHLAISFWQSGQTLAPRRKGPWLESYGQASLLNETQWRLCQLVEQFNPLTDKGSEVNYATLAQLYQQLGFSEGSSVKLEGILEDTVILAPSRITVGWQADSNEANATRSAYPVLLNLPVADPASAELLESAFRKEFFKQDKAQPTYSLPALPLTPDASPKKIRVLLSPALQDAVTHIRRSMRGLSQPVAQAIALAPESQFEGVCPADALAFDLSTYGPRVTGLGPLVFKPVLKVRTLDRVCLLDEGWDRLSEPDQPDNLVVIEFVAQTGNGEAATLTFANDPGILEEVAAKIREAVEEKNPTITLADTTGQACTFEPTAQLASQFKEAALTAKVAAVKTSAGQDPKSQQGQHNQHLSLLSNEDQKLYDELTRHQQDPRPMLERFTKPRALIDAFPDGTTLELAHYQQEGVAWLQTAFLSGKPGVLLADDMGLGKTLQVLTFLAWLLEGGWTQWQQNAQTLHWQKTPIVREVQPGQQHVVNPHPVLVVVPKMLMDNWKSEIEKFFEKGGDLFQNFTLLDNKEIKKYALPSLRKGNDFKTGEPSLNLQLMQSNRLIVANYDTVKNYYQSFAKIPWSCLVMDESQEIKNPGASVTYALACVASKSRFKITMTGTPIENDLMDLWALFDVAAPGLLGSAKEFKARYYQAEQAATSHGWEIEALTRTLGCKTVLKEAQASSYVLGRNKKDFLGGELPALVDISEAEQKQKWPTDVEPLNITCQFRYTDQEWRQQLEILNEIAREGNPGKALKAVQHIKSFSEHPWLATSRTDQTQFAYNPDSLLASSSKFRWLLETLQHIKKREEKALIFTRSVRMQAWISMLLKERFDVDYIPINGAISSKREGDGSLATAIIKRFSAHNGFAALVLSPEVAGVGLNITAANHVIHYGRWWNPAKEDQATCRAYRKGQQNPVYLYVPVGAGPQGETSFDQKLDALLRGKSLMRKDFLIPTGDLDFTAQNMEALVSNQGIS